MVDLKKVEQAVRLLLEGIGEDVNREGLKETPNRIARMYEEIYSGMDEDASVHLSKTFSVEKNEIVLVKDITFYSTCEHHLMPFYGKAHIAYMPDGQVVGLSKLARTVETYARRPQIQEQMTTQIADAIMEYLQPQGVMVMVEAEHMCMTMRGVEKPGSQTVTMAIRGCFETQHELQRYFFEMIKGRVL
jgi:GTP cyclohydrolase I